MYLLITAVTSKFIMGKKDKLTRLPQDKDILVHIHNLIR